MGQLPYWHSVELSSGSRPILREKEVDVLVENSIGLYQGKSKILNRQNGRIYLTSQRLIYIDNERPKDYSLSIEHADIDKLDYTQKFLKSSPKITIFFKKLHKSSRQKSDKHQHNPTIRTTTWICPICSYSNNVQTNINPNNTEFLPVCETCGIKSTPDIIRASLNTLKSSPEQIIKTKVLAPKQISCPTCTFLNHPSLRNCELCGSVLPTNELNNNSQDESQLFDDRIKIETESYDGLSESPIPFMKLSFHKGGDKFFLNRLNETLEKFKWETVLNSGNVNRDAKKMEVQSSQTQPLKHTDSISFGIHSLARQEDLKTMKNEQIINSSLDDLQALLNKANEILELTESFKKLNTNNKNEVIPSINQVTKNLLYDPNNESQKSLYLQEIARQLSDFLINDGILEEEGGIITLIDLYALYNRGRVGINLISPDELYKACEFFPLLKLPLIFRKVNNILVVQDQKFGENTKVINDIKIFITNFGDEDEFHYKSSNILKISDAFNWSLTITEEILKIGLTLGELVIDQQISGKFYYINEFLQLDSFDESRYNTIEDPVSKSPDVLENQNVLESHQTNQVNFPEAPKLKPFPEVPTDQPINHKPNDYKSQSLQQLEGLQF